MVGGEARRTVQLEQEQDLHSPEQQLQEQGDMLVIGVWINHRKIYKKLSCLNWCDTESI